jgi:hypothetical protein
MHEMEFSQAIDFSSVNESMLSKKQKPANWI